MVKVPSLFSLTDADEEGGDNNNAPPGGTLAVQKSGEEESICSFRTASRPPGRPAF
jgi:hypothetical protein